MHWYNNASWLSKCTIIHAVSVGFTKDEIEISPGPSNSTFEVEVSVTGNIAEGDTTTIQLVSSNTASSMYLLC